MAAGHLVYYQRRPPGGAGLDPWYHQANGAVSVGHMSFKGHTHAYENHDLHT